MTLQNDQPISRRTALQGLAASALLLSGVSCGSIVTSQLPATTPHHPLGSILFTYNGHTARVTTVDWSADGKRIASGSLDKTVRVWEAETNGDSTNTKDQQALVYRGHTAGVTTVAWSRDNRRIASGSEDKTLQIWDTSGGQPIIYSEHSAAITAVSWSADSSHLASSSFDTTVHVW